MREEQVQRILITMGCMVKTKHQQTSQVLAKELRILLYQTPSIQEPQAIRVIQAIQVIRATQVIRAIRVIQAIR